MAPTPSEKDKASGEPRQRKRPGRVPVSCAECRRLKLRCDRKVPCETCVKRGCAAICPEGSLTTGKGNRLALADAEELHKKIECLQNRSAALEDALRTLQAVVCDEPHPLLRDESMQANLERPSSYPPDGPLLSQEDEEILDSFGTLTLGLRGESRFFGQTSRSEYLIHAPARSRLSTINMFPHVSAELFREANMELDVPCESIPVFGEIKGMMPTLSQACHLCEVFLEYGQYIWWPIPRVELFDEIMGSIYRSIPEAGCDLARAHAMSLLFMVFALATLFDPKLPSYSVEAHEYYLLARLCLRCAPPLQDTTLTSVQCVIYMAQYLEMSDCEPAHSASHKAWLLIGFAVKLGHSIGLHLNGSRWKLDEDARQRRGRVFWQLFMQDTWISFGFGRPPSISLSFVDCEFPKDPDEKINEQGCKEWGFHHWTWQYTRLLHSVISTTFGAKTPQYSIVLEFDRKIRDFPIPDHLRPQCGQAEEPPHGTPIFMQRYLLMSCKESTLLSLHRPFFVQALSEQPQDLLRHRYGPSVMAIYRSAWRVIEGAKESYKHAGVVASRLGIIWSQCLAGGIVMCLLVTRAPSSPLASSSLTELDTLCDLFEQAACTCQIASNNLDVVHKLRRQGHETMNKSQSQNDAVMAAHELDRLGGKTHLLASTQEVPTACTLETARVNSVTVAPPVVPLPTEIIHPTIMHDLRAFEGLESADLSLFNFDLPSGSQAQPQSAPDIFEDIFSTQTFPTEPGPPVLDATWQAFVEQLGF